MFRNRKCVSHTRHFCFVEAFDLFPLANYEPPELEDWM